MPDTKTHLSAIKAQSDAITRARYAREACDEAMNILCDAIASLVDTDGMSFQQVGEALGISKSWARQLYNIAHGTSPIAGRPIPSWRRA